MLINLLALLPVTGGFASANNDQPTTRESLPAGQLYDSAELYYREGDFSSSILFAERTVEIANTTRAYTQQAQSYLLIARIRYIQGDDSLALALRRQALSIAEKNNIVPIQAKALSDIGASYSFMNQFDSAISYLDRSINLFPDSLNLIKNYGRLGITYRRKDDYEQAIYYYLRSLDISLKINDTLTAAKNYNNIGNLHRRAKASSEKTIPYYRKAIELLRQSEHSYQLSNTYMFLGDYLSELGQYEEAKKRLSEALAIADEFNFPSIKVDVFASLGDIHRKTYQLDSAVFFFNRSLELNRSSGSVSDMIPTLLSLGDVYIKKRDYIKARQLITESLSMAHEINYIHPLENAYRLLFQVDSSQHNYKSALENYQKEMSLRNDRLTLEKSRALDEIREKYETEQKKKIIADQQLVIEKERAKTNTIILITNIVVTAGFALYLYYRYRQKSLFEKEMQHQHELRMKAIVTTQEDTQQRIAKDIHDSVGQTLAAAKLAVETSLKGNQDNTELSRTSSLIDTACQKVRKISHSLLPYSLRMEGLLPAISELLEESFGQNEIEYKFNYHNIPGRLDEQVEINLYRIIQELISNVLKHSKADKVTLQFVKNGSELILWVEDNGRGFDQDSKNSGIGLTNIKSRLELIEGKLNIETAAGQGTITTIKIAV